MLQRLPALRLRFRRNQVGKPFDRGQVHAAVLERAARELAGLGMTQARKLSQGGESGRDHCAATMDLNLGDILAGLAPRARKPQGQGFVDDLSASRIAHPRQAWHAAAPADARSMPATRNPLAAPKCG